MPRPSRTCWLFTLEMPAHRHRTCRPCRHFCSQKGLHWPRVCLPRREQRSRCCRLPLCRRRMYSTSEDHPSLLNGEQTSPVLQSIGSLLAPHRLCHLYIWSAWCCWYRGGMIQSYANCLLPVPYTALLCPNSIDQGSHPGLWSVRRS